MDLLNKIFEFFFSTAEKKDYSKLMEVGLYIITLVAPSLSFLYLYNFNLFLQLDVIKIIIIVILMNVLFFIDVYSFLKYCDLLNLYLELVQYKFLKEDMEEANSLVEKSKLEDKEKEELILRLKQDQETYNKLPSPIQSHNVKLVKDSINSITFFTIFVWGLSIYDYILNTNHSANFCIRNLFLWLSLWVLYKIIKMQLSIRDYIKKSKKIYSEFKKDEYSALRDKQLKIIVAFNAIFIILIGYMNYINVKCML